MTKICPNCKKQNTDTATFCENCGTNLNINTTKKQPENKSGITGWWNKQGKGTKIGSIIGACCLGLLIIGLISAMASPDQTTSTNTSTPDSSNVSTSTATPTAPANSKSYSGLGLNFYYPDSWTMNTTMDNMVEFTTPNSDYNAGAVNKMGSLKEYASQAPAIPATLDSVAAQIRSGVLGTYNEKNVTIGGVNGIEYIPTGYNSYGTERVDVIFVKGDTLYDIWLTTSNYGADKDGFDMIINTMQIQ